MSVGEYYFIEFEEIEAVSRACGIRSKGITARGLISCSLRLKNQFLHVVHNTFIPSDDIPAMPAPTLEPSLPASTVDKSGPSRPSVPSEQPVNPSSENDSTPTSTPATTSMIMQPISEKSAFQPPAAAVLSSPCKTNDQIVSSCGHELAVADALVLSSIASGPQCTSSRAAGTAAESYACLPLHPVPPQAERTDSFGLSEERSGARATKRSRGEQPEEDPDVLGERNVRQRVDRNDAEVEPSAPEIQIIFRGVGERASLDLALSQLRRML
ncbi:hypothetical protein HWV62_24219 [Athelia sp. TMB]|nr:hypothetical protein HWV62_24219 [Athelia sp. TMB]